MIVIVLPIEVVKGEADLLLDTKVLVTHVLHLYRDVAPRPLEGERGWVAEVVQRVHVLRHRLELLLARFELGEDS